MGRPAVPYGADALFGGRGDEILLGGHSDDPSAYFWERDTLVRGEGSDTFMVLAASNDVVIADYAPAQDIRDFDDAYQISEFYSDGIRYNSLSNGAVVSFDSDLNI